MQTSQSVIRRARLLILLAILTSACEPRRPTVIREPGSTGKQPVDGASPVPNQPVDNERSPVDDLPKRLAEAGWPANAAKNVIELNTDWFTLLKTNDLKELSRETAALANLAKYPAVFDVVANHPETALLLAGTKEPGRLADSLRNAERYSALTGLYVQYPASLDVDELASVLETGRHAQVICDMLRRGMLGAETAYMQGAVDDAGSREYGYWLDEALAGALQQSDEELCSTWAFVLAQGPAIRRALIDDDTFRQDFRSALWPKFVRLFGGDSLSLESLMWEPGVWQVLRLDLGDRLIERWGVLPVPVLVGDGAYPEDIRPRVVQILLDGDNSKVQALQRFAQEPLFHELLRRNGLSSTTLRAVCDKLLASRSDYPNKLSYGPWQ